MLLIVAVLFVLLATSDCVPDRPVVTEGEKRVRKPPDSHAHLVAKAREGDQDAWRKLRASCAGMVRGYVHKALADRPDDADDVCQEAFIAAFKSLKNYRGDSSFSTWLIGIARKLVRKWYGKPGRSIVELSLDSLDTLDISAAGSPYESYGDPLENILTSEGSRRVCDAIEKISPKYRSVVTLYLLEQLTPKEIADVVGKPVGTAKSRISRGLKALRLILGPDFLNSLENHHE